MAISPQYVTSHLISVIFTWHPSLHNFTTETREWFANPGKILANQDTCGSCGISSLYVCVKVIVSALGIHICRGAVDGCFAWNGYQKMAWCARVQNCPFHSVFLESVTLGKIVADAYPNSEWSSVLILLWVRIRGLLYELTSKLILSVQLFSAPPRHMYPPPVPFFQVGCIIGWCIMGCCIIGCFIIGCCIIGCGVACGIIGCAIGCCTIGCCISFWYCAPFPPYFWFFWCFL